MLVNHLTSRSGRICCNWSIGLPKRPS